MKYQIIYLCLAFCLVLGDDYCAKLENKECKQCVVGAEFQESQCKCKVGFKGLENKCVEIKCFPECKVCENENECIECYEGMQLENSKLISNKCEKIKCSLFGCNLCKQENVCIQCSQGMTLQESTCKCQEGFTPSETENKCVPCPSFCKKCQSSTTCEQCHEGSVLNDQKQCQCKEGYNSKQGLNYCFEPLCPYGCSQCKSSTQCLTCVKQKSLNTETNKCECSKNQVSVDFKDDCIVPNQILQANFEYNSKISDKQYDFCNATTFNEKLFDNDIILLVDEKEIQNNLIKKNRKKIGLKAFAGFYLLASKTSEAVLYQNYNEEQNNKTLREMKYSSYIISFTQGLTNNQSNSSNSEQTLDNRYVGFDIRDPESLYHFYLIINCGNVAELKNDQIDQLLDYYFRLFNQCPPNCKDCTFQGETVKCDKCIDQFEITDEGKCKYIYPLSNCEKPLFPSNTTCLSVLNDELLICKNNDKCYNCLDQRNEISNMDTDKCTCKKGYYLDERKLECQQCDELCEECKYRKSYCSKCNLNKAYYKNNQCKECKIKGCDICESENICQNCKSGYYINNESKQCQECAIKDCKICNSESSCKEAESGFFVVEGDVKPCSTENCDICDDDKCTSCIEGYKKPEDLDLCQECKEGCKKCKQEEENEICYNCFTGYYLDKKDFQCKPCIKNCEKCFRATKCEKCVDGMHQVETECKCKESNQYVNTNNKCETCSNSCLECVNSEKCTKCLDGYFLNDQKQCQKCLSNCKKCNDDKKCEFCNEGKVKKVIDGKEECSCNLEGCDSCEIDESKEPPKKNQTEESKNKTENEQDKVKEKCKNPIKGYYLSEQKPVKCQDHCEECIGKDDCTVCPDGYVKKEKTCSKCPENCTKCDDQLKCKSCQDGYYLKGECKKCENNCDVCKNENECTKCKGNLILEKGKCSDGNCENPQKAKECDVCKAGYYLDNKKCIKCNENCKTCDKDKCLSCNPLQTLNDQGKCIYCAQMCATCEFKENKLTCLTCQPDYQLNTQNKCQKESNLLFVIIVIFLFAALYFIYQNRQRILNLFKNKNEQYRVDPELEDGDDEQPSNKKKQANPIKKGVDLLDDE